MKKWIGIKAADLIYFNLKPVERQVLILDGGIELANVIHRDNDTSTAA